MVLFILSRAVEQVFSSDEHLVEFLKSDFVESKKGSVQLSTFFET